MDRGQAEVLVGNDSAPRADANRGSFSPPTLAQPALEESWIGRLWLTQRIPFIQPDCGQLVTSSGSARSRRFGRNPIASVSERRVQAKLHRLATEMPIRHGRAVQVPRPNIAISTVRERRHSRGRSVEGRRSESRLPDPDEGLGCWPALCIGVRGGPYARAAPPVVTVMVPSTPESASGVVTPRRGPAMQAPVVGRPRCQRPILVRARLRAGGSCRCRARPE